MASAGAGLHVGVIGVGRIGALHARTLAGLDDVAAVSVTDTDLDRAEQLAQALEVRSAPSAEALVDDGVDALVIATPTPSHASLIRLAGSARVPTFCEKPVALDLATLDAVVDEATRAGSFVQVGFQRRFDSGYRAAHDAVATGALGTVLVLRAATHDPAPPAEEYIATAGGIFRDLHIHDFDAIRFVTGREIVEVYADGAVREARWFEAVGDVDAAAAVVRLDDGVLAVLTGTRHDPRGYDVRLEVFGTRDSISVGTDSRTPLRSVEPGGGGAPAAGYRDFLD